MHLVIPALIAVISAALGYPNPWLHLPTAVLGVPLSLGYIAFTAPSPKAALKRGWVAGSLASSVCLYWLAYPVGVYGGMSWLLAVPCPILLGMFMGLYYAVFSYLMHRAGKTLPPLLLIIFSGLLWTTLENGQGVILTGFPWQTISAAFAPRPQWIQSAAFIGAYGLSGLLASVAISVMLWKKSNSAKIWTAAIIAVILIFGGARTAPEDFTSLTSIGNATIGVVQGNIDQGKKWDSKYRRSTFEKYIHLSEKLAPKSDVVIWPETAMPFYIQDPSILRAKLFNFARKSGTPVLTGAPGYILHSSRSFSLYNRAFLIKPDSKLLEWYDKAHLVPFGEYVPLKDYLPLDKIVPGASDFIPGNDPSPLMTGNLAMGMLICYEGIFPELAQERVEKGANMLINISNDAWYGDTSAPRQHLALVTLRAVEQGRFMVRGTNTGISACIDPLGRVTHATDLFVDAAMLAPIKLMGGNTFYHSNYKVVTLVPIFLTILLAGFIFIKGRKTAE